VVESATEDPAGDKKKIENKSSPNHGGVDNDAEEIDDDEDARMSYTPTNEVVTAATKADPLYEGVPDPTSSELVQDYNSRLNQLYEGVPDPTSSELVQDYNSRLNLISFIAL
jgi:hypothetical protein